MHKTYVFVKLEVIEVKVIIILFNKLGPRPMPQSQKKLSPFFVNILCAKTCALYCVSIEL